MIVTSVFLLFNVVHFSRKVGVIIQLTHFMPTILYPLTKSENQRLVVVSCTRGKFSFWCNIHHTCEDIYVYWTLMVWTELLSAFFSKSIIPVVIRFNATVSFYSPLKTSENQKFSNAFKGCRKRHVVRNGLIYLSI